MIAIRLAVPSDAKAILQIYAGYITQTAITFEVEVPTETAFAERIQRIQQQFPFLVYEMDGRVIGYAYAGRPWGRAAYRWDAELSVYVHPDFQRQGIAGELYGVLLRLLTAQGYRTAYACITYPNAKSIPFHEKLGFAEVGRFHRVGYKLGEWHDVVWMEKQLAPYDAAPSDPISLNALSKSTDLLHSTTV